MPILRPFKNIETKKPLKKHCGFCQNLLHEFQWHDQHWLLYTGQTCDKNND